MSEAKGTYFIFAASNRPELEVEAADVAPGYRNDEKDVVGCVTGSCLD